MFVDVKVSDLVGVKPQKIDYNEVTILRKDLIISDLMNYLSDKKIHFVDILKLSTLPINQQVDIGLIFLEYYGFIVTRDSKKYFLESKMLNYFRDADVILYYLKRSKNLAPTNLIDVLDYKILTTKQLHEIILSWFTLDFRNFRSIDKFIERTTELYDINLNKGHFDKIINDTEFLGLMFNRFVRTQKGSIPFSNDFGSTIKQNLQSNSTFFLRKTILEELTDFVTTLTSIYSSTFKLIDINYAEEGIIDVKLTVYITLQVNQEQELIFKLGV